MDDLPEGLSIVTLDDLVGKEEADQLREPRPPWVRPEGYMGPSRDASPRCKSGGHDFCSCDVCF